MPAPDDAVLPAGGFVAGAGAGGFSRGRALRLSTKVLPEHARGHNRSLVLQTLYRSLELSRADLARSTGLTRVTISDLVAGLIAEGLVVELGQREGAGPGKPATMLGLDRGAFQIIGVDLSEHRLFRGAVLDLGGTVLERAEIPLEGSGGADATAKVMALVADLVARATAPILGIGVGSPGIVDLGGVIVSAPNLRWSGEELQFALATAFNLPVVVANDANVAALAEHSFGGAGSDMILVKIGHGVGAGLLVAGTPLFGSRFAAGEIGHVVVGVATGESCVCGNDGCLETWLAAPRLEVKLQAATSQDQKDTVLREAGQHLGIALAPVVGALNLAEVILSGPVHLIDGPLAQATIDTIRSRTMAEFHGDLTVRMTALGEEIVMRGAAAMVLSRELGVS